MKSIFVLLAATVSVVLAHGVQLQPHSRECFHEDLHKGDQMSVSFQVGDREFGHAGNLDIDFWVTDPNGALQVNERQVSSGSHTFTVPTDGRYVYCFSNDLSSAASKEVSFNVHGIVYVPEPPPGSPPSDPLEHEIRQLAELLSEVKDEQEYIVMRERVHRNTAESTNSRVKWWSIFQLGLVTGNAIWQVWWIRRFFEVKRVV
ncbi:emp24/gp25L/p24 family/GOLD-domain-containing protein [Kalaharituber pfeilii]|nr:emp24/gp25L/p24 family/GOLD-domain-containing protein [Kalaharituber pfeilii]